MVDPKIPMKHIDIFLTAESSYQYLINGCDSIELRGYKINVASKDQIIAMKTRVNWVQKKNSSNGQSNCDLTNTTAKDFDGHTAFPSMTAEEKLL